MGCFVTVTANPALDLAVKIEKMEPQAKLRTHSPEPSAGGGGINVSRVIDRLGGKTHALGFLAGDAGKQIAADLKSEHVDFTAIDFSGKTRTNLTVHETSTGNRYRLLLPSEGPGERAAAVMLVVLRKCLDGADCLVISGSLPPTLEPSFVVEMIDVAAAAGVPVALDVPGHVLGPVLEKASVTLIKPNKRELRQFAGNELETTEDMIKAAQNVVDSGKAGYVLLSLAGDGAVLVGKEGVHHAIGPDVEVKSTVGAGDTLTAAFLYALYGKNRDESTALANAVAAATATVMSEGSELCKAETATRLESRVIVKRI